MQTMRSHENGLAVGYGYKGDLGAKKNRHYIHDLKDACRRV